MKTPVAGVVSARSAKVGAIATGQSTSPLFTIIKDGAIELVADLSESDLPKVKLGQKAVVVIAGGRTKIDGKVPPDLADCRSDDPIGRGTHRYRR